MCADAFISYTQRHAHIGLYCSFLCLLLCGGLFMYVKCVAAVFLTCSQQHVVDVLAVANLSTCSAAAADLFCQDQIH